MSPRLGAGLARLALIMGPPRPRLKTDYAFAGAARLNQAHLGTLLVPIRPSRALVLK